MRPPCPPKGGFSDSDSNKTPTVWVSTKKIGDKVLISVSEIMDPVFLKKYWIKYFNPSLPPNQQDREQDWVYH